MFEATRVGIPLIKKIVDTTRQIEIVRYFAGGKNQVRDEETAQLCLLNGSYIAHVLGVDARKDLVPHQRNTEINFGQMFRGIGQDIPGPYVSRVL